MQEKNFTWADGFHHKNVDPEKAAKLIEDLPEVTPMAVLEAAKPKRSIIHRLFNWDDSDAALQWRLEEARRLIRSLKVTYVEGPKEPVRHFNIERREPKGDTRYKTTHEILSKRETRNDLLLEALRDLQAFRRKYAALSELANIIPLIDSEIETLRATAAAAD